MSKRMRQVLSARTRRTSGSAATERPPTWSAAEPLRIGGVRLPNRIVQAPLAGIGNWAFRRQSRRFGAGLCVSEMVASQGIVRGNRKTLAMLRVVEGESPVAIQLLGAEPEAMAESARAAVDAGADIVDVNMGCPVPKVCKTGAGSALLDDPDASARLVERMAAAVEAPVMVKMRRGSTPARSRPVQMARRLQDAGAAAICLHPRAAAEEYEGTADHAITAEVAAAVDVPVIASGDAGSAEDVRRLLAIDGVEAVAIGRAALGYPWLYEELATGVAPPRPSRDEMLAELRRFGDDVVEALGPERAVGYLRKFYPWYLAGYDVPHEVAQSMLREPTVQEALSCLERAWTFTPAA
ncbi:MAG: tRNA dihydrouridine synthase [Miltoncostaeaceae bacterium]